MWRRDQRSARSFIPVQCRERRLRRDRGPPSSCFASRRHLRRVHAPSNRCRIGHHTSSSPAPGRATSHHRSITTGLWGWYVACISSRLGNLSTWPTRTVPLPPTVPRHSPRPHNSSLSPHLKRYPRSQSGTSTLSSCARLRPRRGTTHQPQRAFSPVCLPFDLLPGQVAGVACGSEHVLCIVDAAASTSQPGPHGAEDEDGSAARREV